MGKHKLLKLHKRKDSKKCKRKHRKSESETESSSGSSQDEWVEKMPSFKTDTICSTLTRDSWMSEPFQIPISVKQKDADVKKHQQECKKATLDKSERNTRELNPYWKNGGTGLPQDHKQQTRLTLVSTTVGDLGLNWLHKALERAKQQAEDENRTVEDVAAERWGSLENLKRLIKEAEDKNRSTRYENKSPYSSFKRSGDRPNKFMKPSDEDNKSRSSHRSKIHGYRHSSGRGWRKSEANDVKTIKKDQNVPDFDNTVKSDLVTVNKGNNKLNEKCEESNSVRLTDQEMNSLAAKLLKAEILGDQNLINELTDKLQTAKNVRKNSDRQNVEQDTVVVLTKTNSEGFTQPIKQDQGASKRKRNNKFETYKDGERVRYFEDDEKYSLKEMFENEKMISAADQNAEFCRLSSKSKANRDHDTDDLFMDQTINKSKVKSYAADAIKEHRKTEKVLNDCRWCWETNKLEKHLIIHSGQKCYICVPNYQSLTVGHCIIVPIYHSTCGTLLDEDVWLEIKDLCKKLTKMFSDRDRDVVFFETAMRFNRYPHMQLHCVPIPMNEGNLAPIYFKKAIMECEKTVNKKLVDVRNMDIKYSIPKGLPYFMVNFGANTGYAHVIENEREFPWNFAQEIIGGMLDIDHLVWRKPRNDDFETQCKKVSQIKEWWKNCD